MNKYSVGWGALVGGLLTAPMLALAFLFAQIAGLPFMPFDLFDWITRVLPGPLVTFGIDMMIDALRLLNINVADTAKTAERIMAVGMFLVIGIVTGVIFAVLLSLRRIKPDWITGLVVGGLFGLPLITISLTVGQSSAPFFLKLLWLVVLFLGWGLVFIFAYRKSLPEPQNSIETKETPDDVEVLDRRRFLVRLGAATATITVAGTSLGAVLSTSASRLSNLTGDSGHEELQKAPRGRVFPNLDDPVSPVPGTRPEYTPLKDFYKVFIRTEPSVVDGATWNLPITGLVENPLMLTMEDLVNNYESFDQYVTLNCISGRIPTSLIGTTLFTGVSVQEVLADAKPQADASYLYITGADGFYESVSLDLINSDERIMFCYAWDGNPLTVDHGFPLRIWIPNRFGMKQPKWITGIEVTDKYKLGYWVERNWSEDAIIKTRSVIDTVATQALVEKQGQTYVPIGGIAFAGARGISKVEVRVDGGEWEEAQLRTPLSGTTWVIWRYEWPFEGGNHLFDVRCYEADGTLQPLEENPPRPDGATGIHSLREEL